MTTSTEGTGMLLVTEVNREKTQIEEVKQLRERISGEPLNSLDDLAGGENALNYYLETLIGQGRQIAADALDEYVSMVVRIQHWEEKNLLPGDRGYADWAMFHYVTPDAHAHGGRKSAIWIKAKEAIGTAQHGYGFDGVRVLNLYDGYIEFFLKCGIDAGNTDKLKELDQQIVGGRGVQASNEDGVRSALEELPDGKAFIMPFDYGGHQTYLRVSRKSAGYRFEYFDRQRQPLTLNGKNIPGYLRDTVMTDSQPVYFEFDRQPAALAAMVRKAQTLAWEHAKSDETLVDGPRKKVLELLATEAKDIGVFGAAEPAQHSDAINCPWASLESIIRLAVGPDALQRQVAFIREVAVTFYIATEHGSTEERRAAGLVAS